MPTEFGSRPCAIRARGKKHLACPIVAAADLMAGLHSL
jgi:hypothetical protein